jgi:hypothetical protein
VLSPTTVDHPTVYYSSLGARQLDANKPKRSTPFGRVSWFQQPSFLSQLSQSAISFGAGGRADSRLVAARSSAGTVPNPNIMDHAAIDKFERFEKWLIENGAAFDMVRCVDTPLSFLLMCFRSVVAADIALLK